MSRKKRFLRAGCITLFVIAFVGYFAFSTLFFSPHEGRFKAPIAGLIPRDVDVYLSRTDLKAAFDGFPKLAIEDEVAENPAVKTFFGSPTWDKFNRANNVEKTLADIEKQLAQIPLGIDVLGVLGGKEISVAAEFTGTRAEDTEWAVYARASFLGKLAVSSLKHPRLIGLEKQGISATQEGDVITLTGPKLKAPIYVTRILDVVVAGTSRKLVDRAPALELARSEDSLYLAAPYADSILQVDRNPKKRDIEIQFNVRKMREAWNLSKPWPDPASEQFGSAFMGRLLPMMAVRRVLGVVDFDEGVSVDLSGEFSSEMIKGEQASVYRAKGFNKEELSKVARLAPADATIFVYVRGPVGTFLRMVLDSMEPAARDNLDVVCRAANYSGVDEVVSILDDSLLDRLAFVARPNDWGDDDDMEVDPVTGEKVYVGPPKDNAPVFAWSIIGWIQNESALEEMRDRFGNAGPKIGLQGRTPRSNGFFKNRIGGGLAVREYWSRLIAGTGHIAQINYDKKLIISNRYKFVDAITRNAVGQGPGSSRLNGRTDFQFMLGDSSPAGSVAIWFNPATGKEIIRSQAAELAENRIKDSINYRTERPKIERQVSNTGFGGRSRNSLTADEALNFDKLVDEEMNIFRQRVVEENLPRELADVDRMIVYLEALTGSLSIVRLDPKDFDITVRAKTPYAGTGQ